jgi:ribosome-associated protein
MAAIEIIGGVAIPEEELSFTAARSSGPGGQNVNKVSTKVTLWFDVAGSPSLTDEVRARLLDRLGPRIGKDGVLRIVSQATRSQVDNKEAALARFVELVREALRPVKSRRPTKVPRGEKARRLETKRKDSARKRERGRPGMGE